MKLCVVKNNKNCGKYIWEMLCYINKASSLDLSFSSSDVGLRLHPCNCEKDYS